MLTISRLFRRTILLGCSQKYDTFLAKQISQVQDGVSVAFRRVLNRFEDDGNADEEDA